MTAAGDVDGDGYGDVLGGAPYAGPAATGRVYVFRGGPGMGPRRHPSRSMATEVGDPSASPVYGAGDVNLDGYADILVGNGSSNGVAPTMRQGTVSLFLGGKTGLSTRPPVVFSGFWGYSFQ